MIIDWNNPRAKVSQFFTVQEVTQGDRRRIPQRGSVVEANVIKLATQLDIIRVKWGLLAAVARGKVNNCGGDFTINFGYR